MQSATEESEHAAPVSLSEILRRVGAGSLLEETDLPKPAGELPPEELAAADEAERRRVKASRDAARRGRGVDRRLHGEVDATGAREGGSPRRRTGRAGTAASGRSNSGREESAETPTEAPLVPPRSRREDADAGPRAVAAERQAGLSAMRNWPICPRHNALNKHARRQMVETIRTKLITMGLGLAAGGVMLWLWRRPGANAMTIYGAAASFVVAVVWGIEYAVMTGRLIVGKAGGMEWKGGKPSSAKPRAVDPEKPSTSGEDAQS